VAVDVGHLFDYSITRIGFRRGAFLRGFMMDFITMFAPHLQRHIIDAVLACQTQAEIDALFAKTEIPVHHQAG